ncbi:MAG: hypothetical protein HZA90_25465 [Verrucomicrobia bacterium]|nr:hypothetical protein [Verrucomicrobiota bacterium]
MFGFNFSPRRERLSIVAPVVLLIQMAMPAWADREVWLTGVPDYHWVAGCFGTAAGNLMGYWDRHGFPDWYTGPTAGGTAPLNDYGTNAGIRALWVSQAGVDGRPADQPGHMDDFYVGFDQTDPDPHVTAHRKEHSPDCIADFIGMSQRRWTNMNGECDGNVDGYAFVYWDRSGARRTNFTPSTDAGMPPRDLQSGLRAFSEYRGGRADSFSQLTDFNPTVPAGRGFTFADMKAEIEAGYPVLLFLQNFSVYSADRPGLPRGNPDLHGMLAYGYAEYPSLGIQWVYYRTSWASGDGVHSQWDDGTWQAGNPLRGVVGYHPRPRIRSATRTENTVTITWDGPSSQLYDADTEATTLLHRYQVERSLGMTPATWSAAGEPTTDRSLTLTNCCANASFYRVRLLGP